MRLESRILEASDHGGVSPRNDLNHSLLRLALPPHPHPTTPCMQPAAFTEEQCMQPLIVYP